MFDNCHSGTDKQAKKIEDDVPVPDTQDAAPDFETNLRVAHDVAHSAATIPQELKERSQWVLWNIELRDDKETKITISTERTTRQGERPFDMGVI